MKRPVWTIGIAAILCLTSVACIEETPSLHPLFATSETLPGIEGRWQLAETESHLEFRKRDDGYLVPIDGPTMKVEVEKEPLEMRGRARFGRLSGQLFADFTAVDERVDVLDGTSGFALWPVHVFARVELSGNRLHLARLNDEWLKQAVTSGQIHLAHEVVGEDLVLTASTHDLQRVIADLAFHAEAFGEPVVFRRVRP